MDRAPSYSEVLSAAVNALHATLAPENHVIPGECRKQLQRSLLAMKTMRDWGGALHLHACIMEVEIMLHQRTKLTKMIPKVLDILESIERG